MGGAVGVESCVFWDDGGKGSVWCGLVGAAEVAEVVAHEHEGVGGGKGRAGDMADGVLVSARVSSEWCREGRCVTQREKIETTALAI